MIWIEGATAEQERLLREILAAFPSTEIRALRVEPYDALPFAREPGSPPWEPTPEERAALLGVALRLVEPADPPPLALRAKWEMGLVAHGFRARSAAAGLEPVRAVFDYGGTGHGLEPPHGDPGAAPPPRRLPPLDVAAARAAAAAAGSLERFDLIDLDGLSSSITIRVDEPHSFMRERAIGLFDALHRSLAAASGWYVEVLDKQPTPVAVRYGTTLGGGRFDRPDVDCCNPRPRRLPLTALRERPPCPVFGDRVAPH